MVPLPIDNAFKHMNLLVPYLFKPPHRAITLTNFPPTFCMLIPGLQKVPHLCLWQNFTEITASSTKDNLMEDKLSTLRWVRKWLQWMTWVRLMPERREPQNLRTSPWPTNQGERNRRAKVTLEWLCDWGSASASSSSCAEEGVGGQHRRQRKKRCQRVTKKSSKHEWWWMTRPLLRQVENSPNISIRLLCYR